MRLDRRTLLRGGGVAMALPLLDAMVPSAIAAGVARRREDAPTRLAFVYVPNGFTMGAWRVDAEGEDADGARLELPPLLSTLIAHREDLLLLRGLTADKARANGDGPGDHARAAAAYLTGVQPLKPLGQVEVGVSADQVAANAIGHRTRFKSLELGCESGRQSGQCDSGYSCAYSSNISWQGPNTPSGKEIDPAAVFDRLFRGEDAGPEASERLARRRSILDFVRADAKRLESRLGAEDRRKLDEYQSGIRELERRLAFLADQHHAEVPDSARPRGVPSDRGQHIRLMFDLLVLAFQTDSTRVATFLVANEGSNRSYPELGAPDGHHTLSHHGNDAEKIEKVRAIDRFHLEQLTHFANRLRDTEDAHGRLMDSTIVAFGSGIADGNRHDHHDLPVLLMGRGNGSLRTGRQLRYAAETPLNNLWLSLLDRVGAEPAGLGDATGRLDRLG